MTPSLGHLRERKLAQWAAAYLCGAWLLLQVLGEAAAAFPLPALLLPIAWLLLGVGLAATLVVAWYHGERGAQRVSGTELLMLAALFVLAGAAVQWVSGGATMHGAATAGAAARAEPAAADARSIAVLPFDNLSEEEDAYFANGITNELAMMLTNVAALKVTNPASTAHFRGTAKPLREIAAELGVAHLLTGSVQRSGERVRTIVQLTDARTGVNRWANRYDEPYRDIFTVQSEIARQITQELQAELSTSEWARLARRPTGNLSAYDYVLRASDHLRHPLRHDYEAALPLLRRARELDPSYPEVHTALSRVFRGYYWWGGDRAWLDSARIAADRAIELDPGYAPAHSVLGLTLAFLGEREDALRAHRRAVELSPNLSAGLASLYQYGFGHLDEAARWWGPALEMDPADSFTAWLAGRTLLGLKMTERAQPLFERAVELSPQFAWPYFHLAASYLAQGKPEQARAQIPRMLAATAETPEALLFAGQIAAAMGDLRSARHYLERGLPGAPHWDGAQGALVLAWVLQQTGNARRAAALREEAARRLHGRWGGRPRRPEDHIDLARILVLEGRREDALRELERGIRRGWRLPYDYPGPGDPILASLRGDPRFQRMMAEVEAELDRQRQRVEREGW